MIIINADDFGMSVEVNRAVVACFRENVISSASIMANMPCFEEACHLAHENGVGSRIGIHFNITEGDPISKRIVDQRKFCDARGAFCFRRNASFFLTHDDKEALREEAAAQIERCRSMGLSLNHLDSHHHVHTEWLIFEAIQPVIKANGIRFVRAARNDSWGSSIVGYSYKGLFNIRLSLMGLRRTRYLGDIEGFLAMRNEDCRTGLLDHLRLWFIPHVREMGLSATVSMERRLCRK